MALVVKDRVKETTSTTGTGALTLGGAVANFVAFSSVLSDGDTTYYAIVDDGNGAFEVGLGTYASAGTTLTRTTVLASSNSGSAVDLQAGTKNVFITYPADKSVYLDAAGDLVGQTIKTFTLSGGTADGTTIGGTIAASGSVTTLSADNTFTLNGTTSATASIISAVNEDATLKLLEAGSGDVGARFTYDGGDNKLYIQTGNNPPVTRLTINRDDGNVGIGTTPDTKLHVNGTSRVTDGTTNIDAVSAGGVGYFGTQTNHPLVLRTNDVERIRIDTSGRLLLNTTVADGNSRAVFEANSAYDAGLSIRSTSDTANWARMDLVNQNTTGHGIIYLDNAGALVLRNDATSAASIGFVAGNTADGDFTFESKVGTERMRILSSGQMLMGQSSAPSTTPSALMDLYQGTFVSRRNDDQYVEIQNISSSGTLLNFRSATNNAKAVYYNCTTDTSNTAKTAGALEHHFQIRGATEMLLQEDGDLHVDGDVIAYSTTISDQRLKDDVETIDSALDKVSNLRGVTYTWSAGSREGKRDLGVIAQEVEAVIPEIVHEKEMALIDGESYKTVDYEKLTAVLIEAVKELKAEVDALKAAQ